jgi:UDP-N-acetylmuramoyl-L-alanyl-D-glutamate--2,6-diaminopimelate ligase
MPRLDLGAHGLPGGVIEAPRLTQDSRDVRPGDAFVALTDAHVQDARQRGAIVIGPAAGLRERLGALADDFYGHPSADLSLVGVTGTNGKTSVVQLVAQAWELLGLPGASIGTIGAGITGHLQSTGLTTPSVTRVHELLAGFRDAGARDCAIEVSSHALEQGRVDGARFDVVAFTNLTRDHLDYHGTMAAYAAAKLRILDLDGSPTAVVNLDDEYGPVFLERAGSRGRGVSSRGHADAVITAADVRVDADGLRFILGVDGAAFEVTSPLIGRFNVDNLLIAAGVLLAQGIDLEAVAGVLGRLQPPLGRMNRIRTYPGSPLVVVDYAHTPDALSQSLTALADLPHERIIAVFGATGDRDRGKRPEMARVVEAGADVIVVTDDHVYHEDGDAIVADVLAGFADPSTVTVLRDRAAAIDHAIAVASDRDVVFLAGMGHERTTIVGDEHIPFSDFDTAERVLRERFG